MSTTPDPTTPDPTTPDPTTPTTTVKVSRLPTYSIVTLVITGVLALASLFFILLVIKQSRQLDKDDEDDIKEPPRQPKAKPTDTVVAVKDKDVPAEPQADTATA